MDLKYLIAQQRRRPQFPSFNIDFVNYSTGQSQAGPSPVLTRASSGTFVNQNGHIVGKTKSTTSLIPSTLTNGVSVIVLNVPSGSVVGWLNKATVVIMQDLDENDNFNDAAYVTGTILHVSDTTLTLKVTNRSTGSASSVAISNWWVSYRGQRLEHDPFTLRRRGLLMEPQRANWCLQSANFGVSPWQAINLNVSGTPTYSNIDTAPDGTMAAYKLIANTLEQTHQFRQDFSAAATTTYTISGFFKAVENTTACLAIAGTTSVLPFTDNYAFFDLNSGQTLTRTGFSSSSITKFSNNWYRCSATITTLASSGTISLRLSGANSSGNSTFYVGNDTNGILVWGAQMEIGANTTSYVPTTITSIVRSQDLYGHASLSSFYDFKGGTIVGQCSLNTPSGQLATEFVHFGLLDGGSRIQFGVTNGGSQAIRAYIGAIGQGVTFDLSSGGAFGTLSPGPTLRKVAFTFANNDARVCLNGALGIQDNTVSLPQSFSPNTSTIGRFWDGIITNIQYYPYRLSNSTLQALTTTSTQSLVFRTETITYGEEQIEITI